MRRDIAGKQSYVTQILVALAKVQHVLDICKYIYIYSANSLSDLGLDLLSTEFLPAFFMAGNTPITPYVCHRDITDVVPRLCVTPPPSLLKMARKDMHLDNTRDTTKSTGRYQTAAEFWRLRERQTVVIQRFWRGFSARNSVWSRREEKWARKARH